MAFDKVNYVDGSTVITADNLNDIQDELQAVGNALSGGTAAQVLRKLSATDKATIWATLTAADVGALGTVTSATHTDVDDPTPGTFLCSNPTSGTKPPLFNYFVLQTIRTSSGSESRVQIAYSYASTANRMAVRFRSSGGVWQAWQIIGDTLTYSVDADEYFAATKNPFNASAPPVIYRHGNTISIYAGWTSSQVPVTTSSGAINAEYRPPDGYAIFPIFSRTGSYAPVGSCWIYYNGTMAFYGAENGGYLYGTYLI